MIAVICKRKSFEDKTVVKSRFYLHYSTEQT